MFRRLAAFLARIFGVFRTPPRLQVAALCWRWKDGEVQILLVTTRNTKRWTPPRGWLMAGRTAPEAAAREAWEEAGAVGVADQTPLGAYRYDKLTSRGGAGAPVEVLLFPMEVRERRKKHPEAKQRDHRWMTRAEAAAAVREPDLKRLIEAFSP